AAFAPCASSKDTPSEARRSATTPSATTRSPWELDVGSWELCISIPQIQLFCRGVDAHRRSQQRRDRLRLRQLVANREVERSHRHVEHPVAMAVVMRRQHHRRLEQPYVFHRDRNRELAAVIRDDAEI